MKQARPVTPLDTLKEAILVIARSDGTVTAKLERIFSLGKPEVLDKTQLNQYVTKYYWLYREPWRSLKLDNRAFWKEVTQLLNFIDYEATNQMGNQLFGYPEISEILGQRMAENMLLIGNAGGLPELTQQALAKDQFTRYMEWYDPGASMYFLVLFGHYLATRKPPELVPFSATQQHQVCPLAGQPSPLSLSLRSAIEPTFYVRTSLFLVVGGLGYQYDFYMTKREVELPNVSKEFVVRQAKENRIVTTKGIITRVLKFFYLNTICLVISGPEDNLLLKFKYDNIHTIERIDNFVMNVDQFDDLLYVNADQASMVATNKKSLTSPFIGELQVVNLSQLIRMRPQVIRKLGDLTAEEKRLFAKQRETGVQEENRPLNEQEKAAIAALREQPGGKGTGAAENPQTLADLTLVELRQIQQTTGYVHLQTQYDYGQLYVRLVPPPLTKWVHEAFKERDVQCLASKIVPVFTHSSILYFHLAVLMRRYTSNKGDYELQLGLFRYWQDVQTQNYVRKDQCVFEISSFLTRDTDIVKATIEEFNLVFHTNDIFHIEVLERRNILESEELHIVNSEFIQFDFTYAKIFHTVRPEDINIAQILDGALFNEVRLKNYKIFNYRLNVVPSFIPKYDAIFYKYNRTRNEARFIFYKNNPGSPPSVAEIILSQVQISDIISITPIARPTELCFLTLKMWEIAENMETGELRRVLLPEPRILRISLQGGFVGYDEPTLALTAQLKESLTLRSEAMAKPVDFTCAFCGGKTKKKEPETGLFYCDEVCQLVFCTTIRMHYV